jgi:hypothetical protein
VPVALRRVAHAGRAHSTSAARETEIGAGSGRGDFAVELHGDGGTLTAVGPGFALVRFDGRVDTHFLRSCDRSPQGLRPSLWARVIQFRSRDPRRRTTYWALTVCGFVCSISRDVRQRHDRHRENDP